jgi:hypothetical protein
LCGLLNFGLFAEKIPPCFTSKGLSNFVQEKMHDVLTEQDDWKLRENIEKCKHDYIRYESLRDINIPRHLGIPHPESYAVQALSVSQNWDEIFRHCELPTPKASRIYIRRVKQGRIFEMNYKGDDQYQLEEDEIGWLAGAEYFVNADISTCFPSIYSHSGVVLILGHEVNPRASHGWHKYNILTISPGGSNEQDPDQGQETSSIRCRV